MKFQPQLPGRVRSRLRRPPVLFEFGSAMTRVILDGRLIFYEPSVLIHRNRDEVLLGQPAYQSLDKLPLGFQSLKPVRRKALVSQAEFQFYLDQLLTKLSLRRLLRPWNQLQVKAMWPSELSQPQQVLFQTSLKSVLPQVKLVPTEQLLSGTTGQRFYLDLGQTITFWVFEAGQLVQVKQYFWGATELAEFIREEFESHHACQLDRVGLDKLLRLLDFTLDQKKVGKRVVVNVKDNQTGLGRSLVVTQAELVVPAQRWLAELLELTQHFFGQLRGPVAANLVGAGLNLFGGLAGLTHLADAMSPRLNCEVTSLPQPDLFLINRLVRYDKD